MMMTMMMLLLSIQKKLDAKEKLIYKSCAYTIPNFPIIQGLNSVQFSIPFVHNVNSLFCSSHVIFSV